MIHSALNSINLVKKHLSANDLDSALLNIQRIVDQVNCEPINTGKIFGSRELDALCQEIGARIFLSSPASHTKNELSGPRKNIQLYIVSRLHPSGGHNKVLSDLVCIQPSAKHIFLITGIAGHTKLPPLTSLYPTTADVEFLVAPRGNHLSKLHWIQNKLLELNPDTTWLFNHHQDCIAVSAVPPGVVRDLRFYHHADHHLCLGIFLDHAAHIDMNPCGFHNCRQALGILHNRYIPLTVRDRGSIRSNLESTDQRPLITCTAAGFDKLEVPYFIQYSEVIPQLLASTKGTHIHIGRLRWSTRFQLHCRLRRTRVARDRFIYIPFVPDLWRALVEYKVDLYLSSFPNGGARTLIEAMGAGIPVAIHLHTHSRLLSTLDIAPTDAITWRTPAQLIQQLTDIQHSSLYKLGVNARETYERNHGEDALQKALFNWHEIAQAPPLPPYPDEDILERSVGISSQFTVRGLLQRHWARLKQRIKAKLS